MVELVKVLGQMRELPEYQALDRLLEPDGREALKRLLAVPEDVRDPIYRVFHRTRNKAGFHFDRGMFQVALRRLLAPVPDGWGPDARSTFVYSPEQDPQWGRVYYTVADQIATEISFGLPRPEQLPLDHEAFRASIDLHAALTQFVEDALAAYGTLREIGKPLREEST